MSARPLAAPTEGVWLGASRPRADVEHADAESSRAENQVTHRRRLPITSTLAQEASSGPLGSGGEWPRMVPQRQGTAFDRGPCLALRAVPTPAGSSGSKARMESSHRYP